MSDFHEFAVQAPSPSLGGLGWGNSPHQPFTYAEATLTSTLYRLREREQNRAKTR